MNMTALVLALGLVLAAVPGAAAARSGMADDSTVIDVELVGRLCSAGATDASEQEACVDAVLTTLAELYAADAPGDRVRPGEELPGDRVRPGERLPGEGLRLLERAQGIAADTQALVDDAIAELRETDLQAAIDEIVQDAQELGVELNRDLQRTIDEALAAFEALELPNAEEIRRDLEAAMAEAVAATQTADLQQVLDRAFAEIAAGIDDIELQATIDGAVLALQGAADGAHAVVTEAQLWALENTDLVCRGGSISLASTVGVAVFALTGIEWLGLRAFWATERFTNGICGDVVR